MQTIFGCVLTPHGRHFLVIFKLLVNARARACALRCRRRRDPFSQKSSSATSCVIIAATVANAACSWSDESVTSMYAPLSLAAHRSTMVARESASRLCGGGRAVTNTIVGSIESERHKITGRMRQLFSALLKSRDHRLYSTRAFGCTQNDDRAYRSTTALACCLPTRLQPPLPYLMPTTTRLTPELTILARRLGAVMRELLSSPSVRQITQRLRRTSPPPTDANAPDLAHANWSIASLTERRRKMSETSHKTRGKVGVENTSFHIFLHSYI
jgi:hypothetical protein